MGRRCRRALRGGLAESETGRGHALGRERKRLCRPLSPRRAGTAPRRARHFLDVRQSWSSRADQSTGRGSRTADGDAHHGLRAIVTLEGSGDWVTAARMPPTRARGTAKRMGDRLSRWQERKTLREPWDLQERARTQKDGPSATMPPRRAGGLRGRGSPPRRDRQHMHVRCARRLRPPAPGSAKCLDRGIVTPSPKIHFGDASASLAPTARASALDRLLAASACHRGEVVVGPRVSSGLFTQSNARPDFARRKLRNRRRRLKARSTTCARSRAMAGRRRQRTYETLSGGEKARLEILCLELGPTCVWTTHGQPRVDSPSAGKALEAGGNRGRGLQRSHVHAAPRPFLC